MKNLSKEEKDRLLKDIEFFLNEHNINITTFSKVIFNSSCRASVLKKRKFIRVSTGERIRKAMLDPSIFPKRNLIGSAPARAILALDLGRTFGWAYCTRGGKISSGSFSPLETKAKTKNELRGDKFCAFYKWLKVFKNNHKNIDIVVYEHVNFFTSNEVSQGFGGYLAMVYLFCNEISAPYKGVSVATIKKATTGMGRASKEDMIEAVKNLGHNPKDDNEADALALLHYAINENKE